MNKTLVYIVMGVSGCGKSTIGKLLAAELGFSFFDGDDYHSQENITKMSNSIPLNDYDRAGWLDRLNLLAKEHLSTGVVIACSALKQSYRDRLSIELKGQIKFVYLEGSKAEIYNRLSQRKQHFMPSSLLDSQFKTLEPPVNAITIGIQEPPGQIVLAILEHRKTKKH